MVEIVNHIRCETRIAIQLKAIDELRWYSKRKYGYEYSPLADRLEKYLGVPWDLTVVNPIRDLDPTELAFYKKYIQTGIA